jgi:dTDP-4-dehydrorhamnose 3,5-epimerase
MIVKPTKIKGAYIISHQKHDDLRGWFQEWYKWSEFDFPELQSFEPKQANISKSSNGVIRGIHYSLSPEGQAKLVTVMNGKINDYIVDLREGSQTFGQHVRVPLEDSEATSVFIGAGLGHAFQSLQNNTVVSYLLSSEYDPAMEFGVSPFCPFISIKWEGRFTLSSKDESAPNIKDALFSHRLPKSRPLQG